MRKEAGHQNQVDRSIAQYLVGDADIAAQGVPRLGQLEIGHRANLGADPLLPPEIAKINPTIVYPIVCLDVSYGSWLRKNALPQFATVRDPVDVVRHGRFEHFFRVGRSGPSLSHRGECWARPRDRHATGVSMLTP